MKYQVIRNEGYDFVGQNYASLYPNLHRYPATMLPQIGVKILQELNLHSGKLLDPYCGSGSSFAAGLEMSFKEMYGYDLNPLAVLITKAKFTKVSINEIENIRQELRNSIFEFIKIESNIKSIVSPNYTNIDYWYSKETITNLSILKIFISKIKPDDYSYLFWVAFSETIRECSYTRSDEFKLFRMKPEQVLNFNPDVIGVYFHKLNKIIEIYEYIYFPKLNDSKIYIAENKYSSKNEFYDVILTSPPYGDSRTTVAYGQFSTLSNEWMDKSYARKIDGMLMGGKTAKTNYNKGIIADYIQEISKENPKRALEVSSFYEDLETSISELSLVVKKGGYTIYVVGNRTVKNIQLPTDQFIAEKFEEKGFAHIITYERSLTGKAMPSKNSPSNIKGALGSTMTSEYIIVCQNVG